MLNNVKFLKGTAQSFGAIEVKDANTFYYIDDKDLYLGSIKLSNGEDLAAAILRVAANETNISNISKDYLKASDKTELSNAIAAEKSRAEGIEGGLQAAIDSINEELGALTGSEEGKSITQMIESAINTLDSKLSALITANTNAIDAIEADYLKAADKTELEGKIKTNTDAITTLNGDTTVDGSVDKKVADAINAFATQVSDDDTINTYKEILNYLATHKGDATDMAAAIDALETKVGEKSVQVQINEAFTTANLDQYATDTELNTLTGIVNGKASQADLDIAEGKIEVLEGKVDVEKVSTAIATAKSEAQTYADGLGVKYATAAQGALADTAIQTVAEGTENGTILVDGESVAVHGLGSAAYTASTAYDAAGSALAAEGNAKSYAKSYADGLAGNYDAVGSAAQALADAKAYANGLAGNYEVAGAAATAKSEAVTAAATDATTKANTAEANAKAYVDQALTWGSINE